MTDLRIVVKPLRTNFGAPYGLEARSDTGVVLATAEQTAMNSSVLIVDETQFDSSGNVVYRGKLSFGHGGELIKDEPLEGIKKWHIFRSWTL
jgi:hypothetical protein